MHELSPNLEYHIYFNSSNFIILAISNMNNSGNIIPAQHASASEWGLKQIGLISFYQPFIYSLQMISRTSGLMRGSPPVRRIFSTPSWTKRRASFRTSEVDNSWPRGVSFTPSSGMQYWPGNRKNIENMQSTTWKLVVKCFFSPSIS